VKKIKWGGFFTGAAILAIAGVICRLLGVVIRIPLTNIVGNFGMGLYQMVFPLYSLLLIVSSAGVPVAISKMVAKEKTAGNTKQCHRILFNSIILLGFIGLIVSVLFMIFSVQIAKLQGNRDIWLIYLAIAPSVFLVCIIASFRGYFQGFQNMVPTATSQIIEQLVKVAAALAMALVFIKISVVWAVFGAILAVTVSEAVALLFLIGVYLFMRKHAPESDTPRAKHRREPKLSFKLMWDIFKQSVPVTLMASIFPLILVMDSMLIINMLTSAGTAHEEATQLYGISSGAVHTLINLPAVLGAAIATAVVPAVSSLLKQGKTEELREKMVLAVKVTLLISIFFAVFYLAFADKLIDLLYHGAFKDNKSHFKLATKLLKIESALILLISISSVFTAMLQGANKAKFPLIALAIGGIIKIAFQLSFIRTSMGIYAVSFGNVMCFAVAAFLNTVFAFHFIKIKKTLFADITKILSVGGIFTFVALLLQGIIPQSRWWVMLGGAISFAIYAILVAFSGLIKFNNSNVGNILRQEQKEKYK
jgi:stage V sporulation protein B